MMLLQPPKAGKIYSQKVVNYRSWIGLNGPESTVELSEVTAEILFTKGFPDYPEQSETKRKKQRSPFLLSLNTSVCYVAG